MDQTRKECRKAVFWEVYWKTKAGWRIPKDKDIPGKLAFIGKGIGCPAS